MLVLWFRVGCVYLCACKNYQRCAQLRPTLATLTTHQLLPTHFQGKTLSKMRVIGALFTLLATAAAQQFPRSYPQLCGKYSVTCQAVGDQAESISLDWSGIVEGVLVLEKKVYADAASCTAGTTPIIEFQHIGSFQDMGPQDGQTDDSANARLVHINYDTIEVTPQTADQVTSMQTNCPCNDATQWVLGTCNLLPRHCSLDCHHATAFVLTRGMYGRLLPRYLLPPLQASHASFKTVTFPPA